MLEANLLAPDRHRRFDVLDDADAAPLVTVQGAHPTAKVVRDRAQVEAAFERALGPKQRRIK